MLYYVYKRGDDGIEYNWHFHFKPNHQFLAQQKVAELPIYRSGKGHAATDRAFLSDGWDRVLRRFPWPERLADATDPGTAGSGDLRCGIEAVSYR